jgi:streptomycin 6-kinase
MDDPSIVAPWLERWRLVADGEIIVTPYSRLLPVRRNATLAMLKIATTEDERNGAAALEWYAGRGAARVMERDGDAVLMERAIGSRSLLEMSRTGGDDEATAILSATIAILHQTPEPPPGAVPLQIWFRSLDLCTHTLPMIARARGEARSLLGAPREVVALHGDVHHRNVLDFATRGWLAIDPKGVVGERAYDYTVMFLNPDTGIATDAHRFRRRVDIVTRAAQIEPRRLLAWIVSYGVLSAAWILEGGGDPQHALSVAAVAANELDA